MATTESSATRCKLVCHPRSPCGRIDSIEVRVTRIGHAGLGLRYELHGDLDGILIPRENPAGIAGEISREHKQQQADELWQHTCFEAFIMTGDGPGYREYNFSPSGKWASYTFRGYRQADDQQVHEPVHTSTAVIRAQRDERSLILQAEVSLARSETDRLPRRPLRLGLSAVVEDVDGKLSYWALRHPPGKPDFHHADAFDLQLG